MRHDSFKMSPKAILLANFSELSETYECVLHAVYKNGFNIFTVELVKASRADFDEAVI